MFKVIVPVGTAWVDNIKDIKIKELRLGDNSGFMATTIKNHTVLFEFAWCGRSVICCQVIKDNVQVFYTEDYKIGNVKRNVLAFLDTAE